MSSVFLSSKILRDVIASRPAAGDAGRLFFSTDEGKTYRDSGSAWQDCSDAGASSGTVTSVALSTPSWLGVAGSPITTTGTLAVTAATGQTANLFLATPNGSTGAVGLRAVAAADLPLATTGAFGAVKPDGTTITIASGVITAVGGGSSAQFPGQAAVTTPPTSGWSTLSPAGNTAPTLDTSGTGYLKLTFGSASDWGYALRAVPSTPYTVTMHVTFMLAGSSQLVGFGFADTSNFGRFASFVGDGTVVIQNENANGTFFNSSAITLRGFGCGIWFQFSDDGSSTRKISVSGDGRVFTDLVSEGRTTNITATKLLLGVYNASMIIDSWQ